MPIAIQPMFMSNQRAYEPQRQNHFEVRVLGIPNARELTLAVAEFSLPNITNSPVEVPRGNFRVRFAGQAEFTGMDSLTVVDFIGVDTEMIIKGWSDLVFNPETGLIGYASDYKKDAIVMEHGPDGSDQRSWQIHGIWPSGVAFGDTLSYDGGEVKRITMTMTYDQAYRI